MFQRKIDFFVVFSLLEPLDSLFFFFFSILKRVLLSNKFEFEAIFGPHRVKIGGFVLSGAWIL